jgi:superfamily I DNA/RNA helicase
MLEAIKKPKIPARSLFVVGDDAQSIYSFRGSKIEIILNFEKEYPGTTEIVLNQNYRSTQPILDLAEKILTHNPHQKKKELYTDNPDNLKVCYYLAKSERDEAEYIIRELWEQYGENQSREIEKDNEIQIEFDDDQQIEQIYNKDVFKNLSKNQSNESKKDGISTMFDVYLEKEDFEPTFSKPSWGQRANQYSGGVAGSFGFETNSWNIPERDWSKMEKLNDCVVLYRTHSQSRSLEEVFLKYHLPYRLVSGTKFLDRKEIKDVLAILKFASNSDDKISLNRFLPLVLDGVGAKTMEKIIAFIDDPNYPLPPKNQEQVFNLLTKIEKCFDSSQSLIELTKELLSSTGYIEYLKQEYPLKSEFGDRMNNIGELYSIMLQFDDQTKQVDENQNEKIEVSLNQKLEQFLAHISLMTSSDEDVSKDTPKINLMSLHQSKGLEYETVFLVGIEDGLLPHINSLMEPAGFEEEVRLAYVGVTRAKKYLHLISAETRVQFGQIKTNPTSRIFRPFLDRYTTRKRT